MSPLDDVSPTTAATAHVRLDQLARGTHVTVCRIDEQDEAMARLMAMGLCVGRQLEVVRQGNPLIVKLLGARIGISGQLARRIVVERRVS